MALDFHVVDVFTTVEQGTKMGRTSLIEIAVTGDVVTISGRGVVVASGRLRL